MLVIFTLFVKFSSIFFQAAGKPVFAVISSLVRDIFCMVPLVCVLPLFMGIDGVLWAAPVSDIVGMAVTVTFTIVFFKRLK